MFHFWRQKYYYKSTSGEEEEDESPYKMLTNIANDLDQLLSDLCHAPRPSTSATTPCPPGMVLVGGVEGVSTLNTLTQHSGDTLGKDSFLSSMEAASRRLGNGTGSSQSLLSSSGSDNLSVDSGHDERTQGTSSPLVFDPNHFNPKHKSLDTTSTSTTATMTPPFPCPQTHRAPRSQDGESECSGELRPINLAERLTKTHTIWLLTQMSRAGAVHLLKDRETGVFIIRKSSQSKSLALSVQNRQTDRANVDHYLIEASDYGMRLQGSAHFFHSIPSLIAHYIENLDELPYRLTLPAAILHARSSRELASLAMLGQDFWLSPVSRKVRLPSPASGQLQKSCSEPIDIRQPQHVAMTPHHTPHSPPLLSVPPAHSFSDFSDFVSAKQLEEEQQQVFKEQFSAQMTTNAQQSPAAPRTVFASSSKEKLGFGPHVLRLRGLKDSPTSTDSEHGGRSGASTPHMQLVDCGSQACGMSDASSQTDFSSMRGHQPGSKPNLYSMTPVELLHLPENTYFRSSLSDKMSDYEDIWRSSYYESDSVKNGSIRGGPTVGYEAGSCVTARSDFSKFVAIGGGSIREMAVDRRQACVVTTTSTDTAGELTLSTVPPAPSIPNIPAPCVNHKLLHLPSGQLSRLKSSSESSLATLASPVYAEPADAVVFRDRQNRVRRRSAPSVSSQSMPAQDTKQSVFARSPAFFLPTLTKDPGDSAQARKVNVTPKKKAGSFKVKQRSGGGGDGGGGGGVMSRSQSMRSPQEASKLGKKPGWQERFNRLKLGTKVLSHSGSPYAATPQPPRPPQLDDALFALHEDPALCGPDTPTVSKFPVYQRSRPFSAIHRGSYFSESSTVQDIISCAMPELMVRPIQTHPNLPSVPQPTKPLSEYDNFSPYAPPSTSSHGTVFCTPWEGGVADSLMGSTKSHLPPAMNLHERVQKWQEANQSFHQQHQQQLHHRPLVSSSRDQEVRQQQMKAGVVTKPASKVHSPVVGSGPTRTSSSHSLGVGLFVQGHITPGRPQPASHPHSPHPHQTPTTQTSQTRPQSMYHQSSEQNASVRHQLTRTFSNPQQPHPSTPQQQPLPPQLRQFSPQHSLQQQHKPGRQAFTESSSLTPDSQTGGLSSNCPDVINCHHVAMDTSVSNGGGGGGVSDDEVWIKSVPSTLQHWGQHVSHQKQAQHSPGSKIKDYIYKLSQDRSTTFGSTIENFIQCTVESQERTPHHVMRNVRQFMTGIKNYLVKHGEGHLEDLIETERNKLGSNEILNIDALIETTLHMCVLRPLKHHIYRLFVDFHGRNNSLELMSRNIKYARTKTAEEIGIKPGIVPPQSGDMETIKHYLDKMQKAYSPLKKLDSLLSATSAIYACVKMQGKQHVTSRGPASLGADDFLPLLIYVLVHCGLVSAEIEADYMWGLLHPSVLTGEGGYYLTTLSSAVLILKNFQEAHESKSASLEGHLPTLGEVQGFLKIAFPDELRDTILWKTLPVRPNMTTKDVCAMIAHKFKITNPQDYGLFLLCSGEESQLADQQCPQILKKDNQAAGKETFFAYKRLGVNIAWPSSIQHT